MTIFFSLHALLLLIYTTFCCGAVFLSNNRLRGSEGAASTTLSTTNALNDESKLLTNPIRYFARYTSEQGRRLVQRCASNIIEDLDETDFTIFESTTSKATCLAMLRRSSEVLNIEEDHPAWAFAPLLDLDSSAPSISEMSRQLAEQMPWGIQEIQADQLAKGDANVTICVVDTGVAINHPDLRSGQINGTDLEGKSWRWDQDRAGHGTHVAGTIAAVGDNGKGVQGAGGFDLFVVRALSDSATGYESDIWKAVQACILREVDIINLSLGTEHMSDFAKELYSKAVEEHGIIMVAAAGNTADETKYFPASHPSVISVGGTFTSGERYFSSVMNDQIEFVAPGDKILSTSVATYALHTPDGFGYAAHRVVGVPEYAVKGDLVLCQVGKTCDDADGGICLFNIGGADEMLEHVVEDCMNGGGKAAVFFNDERPMSKIENVYVMGRNTIPAICVSKDTGLKLVEQLDNHDKASFTVTVGDIGDDKVEYIYETMTGTSMASPHVAASFALLKSHFWGCTNHQLRYALALNAKHPEGGCDEGHGYGTVKVKDAYDWLVAQGGCGWELPRKSSGGCTTL
ncbi:MAG: hypothetical protein SGILL_000255 [Bacillariaceae sp.]